MSHLRGTFGKITELKARPLQKLDKQVHGKHDADSIERSEYQTAHSRLTGGQGPPEGRLGETFV